MRHLKKGRKLKRTASHKKALLRGLATSLFEHKKISTTEAKAKELRPYAEKLISKAKRAVAKEKQGLLPEGQTIDIHNRRMVYRDIKNKAVVQELFDTIAPLVEERPGGYTRIIKTGTRRGDGSSTAIIELVDWSAPQDGASNIKPKKKSKAKKKQQPKAKVEEVVEETVEETVVEETVEETKAEETTEAVEEAKVEEVAPAEETEEAKEEPQEEKKEEPKSEEKNDEEAKEDEKKD